MSKIFCQYLLTIFVYWNKQLKVARVYEQLNMKYLNFQYLWRRAALSMKTRLLSFTGAEWLWRQDKRILFGRTLSRWWAWMILFSSGSYRHFHRFAFRLRMRINIDSNKHQYKINQHSFSYQKNSPLNEISSLYFIVSWLK